MTGEVVHGRAGHVRGLGPALVYETLDPVREASSQRLPTLLCVHGNSSHRGIWRPVAARLDEFRRVLLDARGHGDSERVDPPAYDPDDHAGDLARVIATLGLRSYAIVAHSAGTLAAARLITTRKPDAAFAAPRALVWIDLDPLVPRWQVDYFRGRVSSVERVFTSVEDAVRGFARMYPGVPAEWMRDFVVEGLRPVDGGWQLKLDPATYRTWEPGDVRPDLPRIACPTLVLRGADSRVSSVEGLEDLTRGLPHAVAREIAGATHLPLLEQANAVAAAIREFLGVPVPPPSDFA